MVDSRTKEGNILKFSLESIVMPENKDVIKYNNKIMGIRGYVKGTQEPAERAL